MVLGCPNGVNRGDHRNQGFRATRAWTGTVDRGAGGSPASGRQSFTGTSPGGTSSRPDDQRADLGRGTEHDRDGGGRVPLLDRRPQRRVEVAGQVVEHHVAAGRRGVHQRRHHLGGLGRRGHVGEGGQQQDRHRLRPLQVPRLGQPAAATMPSTSAMSPSTQPTSPPLGGRERRLARATASSGRSRRRRSGGRGRPPARPRGCCRAARRPWPTSRNCLIPARRPGT